MGASRNLPRRQAAAASRAGLVAAMLLLAPAGGAAAQAHVEVATREGPVVGRAVGAIHVFKGIPYAGSAAGARRWAPPAPAPRRSGALDAGDYGPTCIQAVRPDGALTAGGGRPQSEDCLSLNVWAPRGARRAPVMVWIHGGAHRFGSGANPVYDGGAFARDGVVLVTFNYRLGAFGYFAHPALTRAANADDPLGSYGLMDQMAALAWVRANIAAFGGDPANVTVFGESAGGASILALLATPSAKGLFDKAVVQSGGGWQAAGSLADEERKGAQLATAGGLAGPEATVEQLRALPPEKLLVRGGAAGSVGPFADGRLVKESPAQSFAAGRALDVPLVIGSNSFEASLRRAFPIPTPVLLGRLSPEQRTLYDRLGSDEAGAQAAYTDVTMGAPARWIAARASGGAPAYLYHFSYVPTAQRATSQGASHAAEIPYVFETGSKLVRVVSEDDRAMERRMHACWVAFAKTGRPSCPGAPAWPAYEPADDRLMEFGVETAARKGFRKAFLDAAEVAAGR